MRLNILFVFDVGLEKDGIRLCMCVCLCVCVCVEIEREGEREREKSSKAERFSGYGGFFFRVGICCCGRGIIFFLFLWKREGREGKGREGVYLL